MTSNNLRNFYYFYLFLVLNLNILRAWDPGVFLKSAKKYGREVPNIGSEIRSSAIAV
jgi:hypothetical protein